MSVPRALSLTLALAAPVAGQQRSSMDVDLPFTRFTLENGLNVIVHEDHALPLVSVNVWYHVGSKNEEVGRTGFAHLFEHVMFEGSGNVPEGDFDNLLESVGGVNNGSTTQDRTNYWETVPSTALELALWLESDRMGFLLETMTQAKLDIQRDVVKNERRQSYENRPYGRAFETALAALYPPDHPYHWPVIGSMEDLSAATLDDVRTFFRAHYAPNNASLAVAGDVDVDEVRALAQRYFGDIPAGPPLAPVVVPPGALEADRVATLEDDVSLARLYLAWRGPRQFTQEDAVMEVLAAVLADGKGARLYRRLVYDERVAQDVSAFQNGGEADGSFFAIITAKPDVGLGALEAAVREEIARIARDGVAEAELGRALAQVEASFVEALERVGGFGGKADRLNEYHVLAGSAGFLSEDLARFRRVAAADVARAARSRLEEPHSVILSVIPRGRPELATRAGG